MITAKDQAGGEKKIKGKKEFEGQDKVGNSIVNGKGSMSGLSRRTGKKGKR